MYVLIWLCMPDRLYQEGFWNALTVLERPNILCLAWMGDGKLVAGGMSLSLFDIHTDNDAEAITLCWDKPYFCIELPFLRHGYSVCSDIYELSLSVTGEIATIGKVCV